MKHYLHKKKIFQVLIKILQINNFQGVNIIDSDIVIYKLYTSITSVYVKYY